MEDTCCYGLNDEQWGLLEPLLPGRAGQWGGVGEDNRKFIDAVFWILRTGAPWRDLPERYGDWKNTNRRFCRWRDKGIWEKVLLALIDDPDFAWLMVDPCPSELPRKRSAARCTLPWMRMICRSEPLSLKLQSRIMTSRQE